MSARFAGKVALVTGGGKRLGKAEGSTLVVTDGVFSMDGDLAELPALCAQARRHGAWMMVDDAHASGGDALE